MSSSFSHTNTQDQITMRVRTPAAIRTRAHAGGLKQNTGKNTLRTCAGGGGGMAER